MARSRAPKATRFKTNRPAQGLPDRDTLLGFVRQNPDAPRAAIAQAFGLKGADRRALREMLRELEESGALVRRGGRRVSETGSVPPVGVADVVERDADGELWVQLSGAEDAPKARLVPDRGEAAAGAPGLGDRLLVRFERREGGEVEARLIKRLGQSAHRILGVVRKARREVRVEPVDRRTKQTLVLTDPSAQDLRDGDLVLAQVGSAERRYGPHRGKVLEVVGREDEPRAASLIAIHTHGIPMGFTAAAEAEAEAAEPPTLAGREDLRNVPFVTIDPIDARKWCQRMRRRPRGAGDFERLDAAHDQRVGNERTVAAPRNRLGAHDRRGRRSGEGDQLIDSICECFRLHVVRISTKRFVAPSEID